MGDATLVAMCYKGRVDGQNGRVLCDVVIEWPLIGRKLHQRTFIALLDDSL